MLKYRLMEDAPYRNTRSSAGSQGHGTEKVQITNNQDISEVFDFNGQTLQKAVRTANTRVRTPSGHILTSSAEDIRNFSAVKETASPLCTPLNSRNSQGTSSVAKSMSNRHPQSKDNRIEKITPTVKFLLQ